ncbi:protein themis isoform x2 [Pitangus sulphuratus]|nr:protein themis isoform x2 [Pitangus sulphuratus]
MRQEFKGDDSTSLLGSCETPPGVLHLVLGSSPQERYGLVGASPQEGQEEDEKDGAPLLQRQRELVGVVQAEEERTEETL